MSRCIVTSVVMTLLAVIAASGLTHADIYRWDNGQLIPGTEGIEPGPGVQLDHRELAYADLSKFWGMNLRAASFEASNLAHADLSRSWLSDANLTGAAVTWTDLSQTTARGLTKGQLYSTASYQAKNLQGINLTENDLSDWDFSGQDLTNASLPASGVVFTDATVAGGWLQGITDDQLYSTASYQAKDLSRLRLRGHDLTSWDLSGQKLVGADLTESTLVNTDLEGALVTGVRFTGTTSHGFTEEQLYSTASYQAGDLRGVRFGWNDLSDWDFSGQDLSNAFFAEVSESVLASDLTNADLSGANLTNVVFSKSDLSGAVFQGAVINGANFDSFLGVPISKEQLYSTASFQQKNLRFLGLHFTDLSNWDLSGQDMTNADLSSATLTSVDLTGANLANVNLIGTRGLQEALLDSTTTYSQFTMFPNDFDAEAAGLTLVTSARGDFDADNMLGVPDIEMLATRIMPVLYTEYSQLHMWLPEAMFDLNGDTAIDLADHHVWVKDIAHTWFGDANLDGEFNTGDLVQVLGSGRYERGWLDQWGYPQGEVASWSEGDWNGDGVFDTGDLVKALEDGGYEMGLREDAAAVPEPGALVLLAIAVCLSIAGIRSGRSRTIRLLLLVVLEFMVIPRLILAADIYTVGYSVWRNDLQIAPAEPVEWPSAGIAVDPIDEKVYWTRHFDGGIVRANLDGTDVEIVMVPPDAEDPHPIAIDPVSRRMFWSNGGESITSANLDGTDVTELVTGGESISGIVLDVKRRKVFWIESGNSRPGQGRIRTVGFDGTQAETVLTIERNPNSIALDSKMGQLYYDYSWQEIHRVNLDGTNDEMIGADSSGLGLLRLAADSENGFLYVLGVLQGGPTTVNRLSTEGEGPKDIEGLLEISDWCDAIAVHLLGDFTGDYVLDNRDIDLISGNYARGFDVDKDGVVGESDREIWVHHLKGTWYGDANLDGEFDTGDLVQVLEAGKYETQEYAGWAEGDWNGDGVFGTGDLVKALEDGGYERGPRMVAVPEPLPWMMMVVGSACLLNMQRRRWM